MTPLPERTGLLDEKTTPPVLLEVLKAVSMPRIFPGTFRLLMVFHIQKRITVTLKAQ